MLLFIRAMNVDLLNTRDVSSVQIASENGSLQVLDDHAPTCGIIKRGFLKYEKGNKHFLFETKSDGIFFVGNNKFTILC